MSLLNLTKSLTFSGFLIDLKLNVLFVVMLRGLRKIFAANSISLHKVSILLMSIIRYTLNDGKGMFFTLPCRLTRFMAGRKNCTGITGVTIAVDDDNCGQAHKQSDHLKRTIHSKRYSTIFY